MNNPSYLQKIVLVTFFSIISITVIVVNPSKILATSQCAADGGSCTSSQLCAANCNQCRLTLAQPFANVALCPSGQTCCNGSFQPNCNTDPTAGNCYQRWNNDPTIACTPYCLVGGGGGGGGGCSVSRSYYECETNPTFGACGYLYNTHGGPAFNRVTQDTCGNYYCTDQNTPCDSQIKGLVFLDSNRDGVQDNGEQAVGSSLATTLSLSGNNTNYSVTTGSNGTYTIGNGVGTSAYAQLLGGTWIVQVSGAPNGYTATTGQQSVNVSFANRNPGGINFGIAPQQYTISGTIFTDYNHDGSWNGSDAAYTNSTVTVSAVNSSGTTVASTTTSTGNYSLTVSWGDKYTIQIGVPSAYQQTTANHVVDFTVTGANTSGQNLGITPLYRIDGIVYNDVNLNDTYDAGVDQPVTSSPQIQMTGPTNTSVNASGSDGTYSSGNTLLSGQYTVTYTTALPAGSTFENKTSSYVVSVGNNPSCSVGGNGEASCNNASAVNNPSISNLNFALTNENTQPPKPICDDIRIDSGYSGFIPSTESCNGTSAPYAIDQNTNVCPNPNMPGILFSGTTNPTYGGGSGASTTGQQVGNASFPENYTFALPNTNDMSYSFITTTVKNNSTVTPIQLTSVCPNLKNCVLSESTPGGIYETASSDGPVSISISNGDGTFDLGSTDYVFLIGGNLTFSSNVLSPTGNTAVFISNGDIDVASNVGESNWTSLSPDLEGIFSAGGNFIMDTATSGNNLCQASGQPYDKKLNIVGSVITNANGSGGTIVNNRHGCVEDLTCPGVTIAGSPTQLLHLESNANQYPNGALKPPYSFWQELNP